ncbi:MAG: SDR family oxidoreductase [Sulfurimonas sp.]|jgi:NAD(P)-dependent dehydrogenase (short-subunit alcohol dehydrogenase family)|uniref:SDR family oxidoreductase n=1 Tax=unclassified Sulfurimonas TaxID=2623549 RepID=UPI000B116113|nr:MULTISPECIES: SDR family oxidoreductase [unclassified Sulfurimonas]MBS4069532.1 SDR family oxidoreductase [Sulfurimonas sp.]MDD3854570.1 SDR family oxidoreductase [Sulfurimonas sp.]
MSNIVLVTGASSGMGRATVELLAKKDFIVYAATRDIKTFIDLNDSNIIPVELDLTNQQSIDKVIERIKQKHKKIDVLVNNAGYGLVSTVEDVTEDEMYNQFNINVFGVLRVCKSVIPLMREERSGVIINISSFLGKIGLPLLTLYNSSKYAVEGITDSLRYELKDFNIRVHSIMPGFFDTKFARENLVTNAKTFDKESPYAALVSNLAPIVVDQINNGNSALEVADMILEIIQNPKFSAHATVGDKAKKFIPMKKELSDEDFERRVVEYYNL